MAITCTDKPNMLRVDFAVFEDESIRREVVCYLEANARGQIEILYSHHTDFHRSGPTGPWEAKHQFMLPLIPATVIEITANVMHEFWSAFGLGVRKYIRTGKMPAPVPEQQLGGGLKFVG